MNSTNDVDKLKAILDRLHSESMGTEFEGISSSFRFYTNPKAGFIELERIVRLGKVDVVKVVELPSMEVLRFRCFLEAWLDHSDREIDTDEDAVKLFDLLVELSKLSA